MNGHFTARVWDASRCTVGGRQCWMAAIEINGEFRPTITGLFASTEEADTLEEAVRLAEGLLRARGVDPEGRVRIDGVRGGADA